MKPQRAPNLLRVSVLVSFLTSAGLGAHQTKALALREQNQSSQTASQESGASSQDSTATTQDSNPDNSSATNAPPITLDEQIAYDQLINEVGWEAAQRRHAIDNGIIPVPLKKYSLLVGISKNEEQTMRVILVDAFQKLQESYSEWSEYRRSHMGSDPEAQADITQRMKQLDKQDWQIRANAVARLRQALGEKTFEKVDAWVDQNETLFRTPRHPDPMQQPTAPTSSQIMREQK
jgi:hypothetical protein